MDNAQMEALTKEFKEWLDKQEDMVELIGTALLWAQNAGLMSKQKAKEASQSAQLEAVLMWWLDHMKRK